MDVNLNAGGFGELTMNLNAKVCIDDDTFYTCLKLITLYLDQKDVKGVVLRVDRCMEHTTRLLMTDDEVRQALFPGLKDECINNGECEL